MADAMIRRFLFLQGPHGPYFAMLAEALRELGYSAFRINLNGGDKIDWPGEATDYRGTFGTWPLFFDDFIVANGITDLILYGDCRPYHASAHGMARLRGLRVHVVEEGYIRPDFLTLEEDGVNGNSSLPLDPQWYLAQARRLPDRDLPYEPVPSTFKQRAQNTMRHGIASTLWGLYFPFYRTHRSTSFALESVAWGLKLLLRDSDRRKAVKAWDTVKSRRYFTLPLQLNSDYQIRVHSPFADMRAALIFALKSFARHAPADVSLVIKRHPLDPGLVPWERLTHKLAASYGIADRVFYLADWDIAEVVHHSIGVVTVNSTVGTLALNGGKPVTVLGHAVYKVPGIVHHGPLDAFWAAPQAPGLALYDAFRRVLVSKCLIRGGMLSEEGLAMLVRNAVVRLTEERRMDVMPQDKLVPGKVGVHFFPPPSLAQSR